MAIASLPGFRPRKLSLRRSVADRASLAGSQREVRRQRDRRLPHCRVRCKGRPATCVRRAAAGSVDWASPVVRPVLQPLLAAAFADPCQIEPIETEGGEFLALGSEVVA